MLIFLGGGLSHLNFWDMKLKSPQEVRGSFKRVATTATGVRLWEHLPRLAAQMRRCALLRDHLARRGILVQAFLYRERLNQRNRQLTLPRFTFHIFFPRRAGLDPARE